MKILKKFILILMITTFFTGCKEKNQSNQNKTESVVSTHLEEVNYRPNFHFTPKKAG